jgi:hypothetical protein
MKRKLKVVRDANDELILNPEGHARCCDQVYYCPSSNDHECPVHGGFDVCCDRIDLHEAPRYEKVGT